MTSVGLVWSNLGRRKLRTTLSTLSILVAFLLYGYLSAIKAALDGGSFGAGGQDRLVVRHRVSISQPLPGAYGRRIAMIPGVTCVTHATWFGGIYQDPKNFFGQLAVVPKDYLQLYPEDLLSEDAKKAWFSTKNGAIAGRTLAEKYGWKVGDHIPLKATIWQKTDGSLNWDFTLVGIYDGAKLGTDTNRFLFRSDYFDDARLWVKGKVGWYVVGVNSADAAESARRIDNEFADSSVETKTESEGAFVQGFAKQVGDIGAIILAILGPVFLTILLIAAHTIRQSIRERTAELGVLKAMGFSDRRIIALVLAESCFLACLGGGLGLGTAWLLISAGDPTRGGLPLFHFPTLDLLKGVALVVVLGAVTDILPAVMRSGADTEMMSILPRDQARVIGDAPGILRNRHTAAVSVESLVVIELPKRATSTDANVPLRGVDQGAVRVHDKVRIVRGRNFESGRNEVRCCFVMSQQAILTANLETKF